MIALLPSSYSMLKSIKVTETDFKRLEALNYSQKDHSHNLQVSKYTSVFW